MYELKSQKRLHEEELHVIVPASASLLLGLMIEAM